MSTPRAAVGKLVVCPTPIGNLQDVTLRVLAAFDAADVIACEDTRRTRTLLERHGIGESVLVSFHQHNERARKAQLLRHMRDGATVALASDAGTPLVSDPGFELVRGCLDAGVAVEVLPGPSAVITALVASGLRAERWCFVGFLPRRRAELERLLAGGTDAIVAFESPRRLVATLALVAALDPDRELAVCRELTKLHEEVRRGSAFDLAGHYARAAAGGSIRGELVLVLGRAGEPARAHDQALQAIAELVAAGARPRAAAAAVASLTGASANELYRGHLDRGR